MFYKYLLTLMKNVFSITSKKINKKLQLLSKSVFSYSITFSIECNKGPFLDVNLQTMFFRGKKPKVNKSKKKVLKNNS